MDADNLDPRLRGPDPSQDTTTDQQSQQNAHQQPTSSTVHPEQSDAKRQQAPTEAAEASTSHAVATTAQDGFQQQPQAVPSSIAPPTAPSTTTTTTMTTASSSTVPLQLLAPSNSYHPTTSSSVATVNTNTWNRPPTNVSQQHSPATPHSAPPTPGQHHPGTAVHAGVYHHGGEHGGTPGSADPKRSRACEACRGLKVRCEPADPANPDAPGPCKRCAKAGRQCIVTVPTRKRQKKPDSRVAELEKKIDALTASLNANRGAPALSPPTPASVPMSGAAAHGHPAVATAPSPDVLMSGTTDAGSAATGPSSYQTSTAPPASAWATAQAPHATAAQDSSRTTPFNSSSMVAAGLKRKLAEAMSEVHDGGAMPSTASPIPPRPRPEPMEHNFSDIVDRDIITMEKAAELWDRYVVNMVPHLPAVVFPPETTAADIRKNKPTLFLAIMASAAAEIPAVQKVLIKELMQMFAHKIIVMGEKYLELIQALQVAVIWYYPPDHFEELKFYQLVHIAAVMAIDIGLGRRRPAVGKRQSTPYTWRDHPYRRHPFPDSSSLECRRTWLTCYFLASNTSMALHRPNLIRWTPFLGESLDILRTSPEAAPTDEYLCHLVWTHKLAEEVGEQFELDDPAQLVSIADKKTQRALRGFEYDLAKYSSSIRPELQQPSLRLSFHVLSLYMHEVALHVDKEDLIRPPIGRGAEGPETFGDKVLTSHHIKALSACLDAIDGIFETFLSMDIQSIRSLPVFNYVRVAYAVVVLIKLYFSASAPNSELGRVIDKDNMKVEQHLNSLLEKFKMTASEDRSRPAAKFLLVLVMLRSWFQTRGKCVVRPQPCPAEDGIQVPFPSQSSDDGHTQQPRAQHQAQQAQQQHQQGQGQPRSQQDFSATANTPLQLLSEVATNDPSRNQPQTTGISSAPVQTPIFGSESNNWGPAQHMFLDGTTSSVNQPSGPEAAPSGTSTSGAGPANTVGSHVAATVSAVNLLGEQQQQQQYVMPWLNPVFNADMDYNGLMGDGWEQAMTLAGFGDGMSMAGGMGMADGMGFADGFNLDLTQLGIPDGAVGSGFF